MVISTVSSISRSKVAVTTSPTSVSDTGRKVLATEGRGMGSSSIGVTSAIVAVNPALDWEDREEFPSGS